MIYFLSILLACAPQTPPPAPRSLPANSLARALATFEALDTHHDRRLDATEVARLGEKGSALVPACDENSDGLIDRDEFLVLYRKILLASGQRGALDLETETARVEAGHRARAALSGRRLQTGRRSPVASSLAAVPSVRVSVGVDGATSVSDARIQAAFGRIERQAFSGRSAPMDFDALRAACLDSKRAFDPVAVAAQFQSVEGAWRDLDRELHRQGVLVVVRLCALREALRAFRGEPRADPVADGTRMSAVSSAPSKPATEGPREIRLRALLDDLERKIDVHEDVRSDLPRLIALARRVEACGSVGAREKREQVLDRAAHSGLTRADVDELREALLAPAPVLRGPTVLAPRSAPEVPAIEDPRSTLGSSPRPNPTPNDREPKRPPRE